MSENKVVKTIAKTTRIWVELHSGDDVYFITSNADRSQYTVYKKVKAGYEKLGSGKDPFDLEEKFVWKNKGKKKK